MALLLGPEERLPLALRLRLGFAIREYVVEAVVPVRRDQPLVGEWSGARAVAVAPHDAARRALGERHRALAARVRKLLEERLAQGHLRLQPRRLVDQVVHLAGVGVEVV